MAATNDPKRAAHVHVIRGLCVMLDDDLARLYGTATKRLNEQVSRNEDRFPAEFAFRLTAQELTELEERAPHTRRPKRRSLPRVFTAGGAVMVSSVLSTRAAVAVGLEITLAFLGAERSGQPPIEAREVLDTVRELRAG